ncbi:MAG TPA: HepT-like ribonuclease domain-containing protein [Gallionella sp.]|nr:HepT-like ribonuclease domain-containing protein [Gallionella sp.]
MSEPIIGTRNRLIRGYVGINNDIVSDIIKNEIPALIEQIHALQKAADGNQIR